MRSLGARLHWLDQVDGDSWVERKTCAALTNLIQTLRPRAIFGHWPIDLHMDHMMSAATLQKAVRMTGYNGEFYRDAQVGGYIQYALYNTKNIQSGLSVMCRFTTADRGRVGSIYIDGRKLETFRIPPRYNPSENGFYNVETPIPDELLKDSKGNLKSRLVFQLKAEDNSICPGLYLVRLLKEGQAKDNK